jgi:uncharacterized protein (UPF0264 family)
MTQLLVSVRSAAEAETALAGGAHVIDVKEPSRGSLGRADDATLAEVVRVVAGRAPVSAALGELHESAGELPECAAQLRFVKWGLSRFRGAPAHHYNRTLSFPELWMRMALLEQATRIRWTYPACELVTVAYADAHQADAPDVERVCEFLLEMARGVLLLDTFGKDGRTLLDWLDESRLERLVERCRTAGVRVALAGSLGFQEIRALRRLRPDWFAVRGAACQGQRRTATIDVGMVGRLAELIEDGR